ncbi:hypothetical protein L2E82_38808 [Cichorium intybus]|uniref:Uncharacterized protein n=1 Tax=Cichorium intybus TaxID=13427 RepID=A0ACB9AGB7_CICIN|nr:hypothetical protein L2E82_38808 [Cichorium intybus]
MASKVHSGNDAETEIPATAAVETERAVEAEEAPDKEATPVADRPTFTELAPAAEATIPKKKRPGCPEDCVFRVIVPVLAVESIIGQNEDLIKKMREETKADIRVLEGPVCHPDRIVLISGKEEIELPLSPAMDAVIRVFKRVNGFPVYESDGVASIPFCSIRLLVPSMQAMSLIEKQGSSINTIQENTGCSVHEVSALFANSDDRVVGLHGEALKVLQDLEAVLRHLRKFLVDSSLFPLFEKTHNATATQEKHQVAENSSKTHTDTQPQSESLFPCPGPHQESR